MEFRLKVQHKIASDCLEIDLHVGNVGRFSATAATCLDTKRPTEATRRGQKADTGPNRVKRGCEGLLDEKSTISARRALRLLV